MNIIFKLRAFDSGAEPTLVPKGLLGEAADEIDRLREMLEMTPEQQEVAELKLELMRCHVRRHKMLEALANIAQLDPLTQGDIAVHLAVSTLQEDN